MIGGIIGCHCPPITHLRQNQQLAAINDTTATLTRAVRVKDAHESGGDGGGAISSGSKTPCAIMLPSTKRSAVELRLTT